MIAEMVMAYETVRLLWQKAAWEVDQGDQAHQHLAPSRRRGVPTWR